MSYEPFYEVNTVLPLLAFGWLAYKTREAWPAEWAKPHHVWHYRALLILVLSAVMLTSVGAILHEPPAPGGATSVSMLYTIQSIAVIALCALWPPRKFPWLVPKPQENTHT